MRKRGWLSIIVSLVILAIGVGCFTLMRHFEQLETAELARILASRDCMSDGLGNRLCWTKEQGFTTVKKPVQPCIEGFSEWIVCRRPDGKWYKMVKEFIVEESKENK
jgi:hypothetical protein